MNLSHLHSLPGHTALRFGVLWWSILLYAVWLYWPGLYSIFIFDDAPNLERLSRLQSDRFIQYWQHTGRFISEGFAGPMGRPVSLLSFALQTWDWPTRPQAFKYINLMIHLLNSTLILWLCLRIGRLLSLSTGQVYWFAL